MKLMKLNILFAGICTHFRYGVAAGVPHRVVLPDASKLTLGLLTVAGLEQQTPAPYYLLPHFAKLQVTGVNCVDISDWVKNGDVLAGIRLQVLNATETEMKYDDDLTPSLTEFVPGYTFSSDVVLSGRAALYFDLYGGEVTSTRGCGGAMQTLVTLTTEGRPELLVTPLARQDRAGCSYRWCLGNDGDSEVQLNVCNLELDEERKLRDDQGFDFMLNYLTARGGIPQSISKRTPGLPSVLKTPPPAICPSHTPGSGRRLTPHFEATPSCSDSQYP